MPAGEGGSFFRALVPLWLLNPKNLRSRPPLTRYRWPPLVVQVWVDDASARNYSVVYESYFFLCLLCSFVQVCALVRAQRPGARTERAVTTSGPSSGPRYMSGS